MNRKQAITSLLLLATTVAADWDAFAGRLSLLSLGADSLAEREQLDVFPEFLNSAADLAFEGLMQQSVNFQAQSDKTHDTFTSSEDGVFKSACARTYSGCKGNSIFFILDGESEIVEAQDEEQDEGESSKSSDDGDRDLWEDENDELLEANEEERGSSKFNDDGELELINEESQFDDQEEENIEAFQFIASRPGQQNSQKSQNEDDEGDEGDDDDKDASDENEGGEEEQVVLTWQEKEEANKEEGRYPDPRPAEFNDCSGGTTERPSWHELSLEDKNLYIAAVQCLMDSPSTREPLQGSQYDDFVYHHMNTATRTHFTPGLFLTLITRIPRVSSCFHDSL
jgi:hypothetical protein